MVPYPTPRAFGSLLRLRPSPPVQVAGSQWSRRIASGPDAPQYSRSTARKEVGNAEGMVMISDFDVCKCGDYRHQHLAGTGRCLLGNLCTPTPCGKFQLYRTAFEDSLEQKREKPINQ